MTSRRKSSPFTRTEREFVAGINDELVDMGQPKLTTDEITRWILPNRTNPTRKRLNDYLESLERIDRDTIYATNVKLLRLNQPEMSMDEIRELVRLNMLQRGYSQKDALIASLDPFERDFIQLMNENLREEKGQELDVSEILGMIGLIGSAGQLGHGVYESEQRERLREPERDPEKKGKRHISIVAPTPFKSHKYWNQPTSAQYYTREMYQLRNAAMKLRDDIELGVRHSEFILEELDKYPQFAAEPAIVMIREDLPGIIDAALADMHYLDRYVERITPEAAEQILLGYDERTVEDMIGIAERDRELHYAIDMTEKSLEQLKEGYRRPSSRRSVNRR